MSKDLFADAPTEDTLFADAPTEDTLFGDAPTEEQTPIAAGLPSSTYKEPDTLGSAALKVTQNFPDRMQKAAGGILMSAEVDPLAGTKAAADELARRKDAGEDIGFTDTGDLIWNAINELPGYILSEKFPKLKEFRDKTKTWSAEKGREFFASADAEIKANQPQGLSGKAQYAIDVLRASQDLAPAVIGSVLTRNPAVGGMIMGGQVSGHTYGDSRKEGLTPEQSKNRAQFYAVAEGVSETIPLAAIIKKGSPFAKKFIDATFGEGMQEGLVEVLTQTYDNATIENMTLKDALLNINLDEVAYAAAVGVGVGGTLATTTTAIEKTAEKLSNKKQEEDPEDTEEDAPVDSADLFGDAPLEETNEQVTPVYENGVEFEVAAKKEDPQFTTSQGATPEQQSNQYENGIDMPQKAKGLPVKPLNSSVETPVESEKRVETDKRISAQNDQLKGVKEPVGLNDARIKRIDHREALKAAADQVHQPKQSEDVDPTIDDLQAAIAKAGGINRAEAESQGIDPEHFKDGSTVFGKPVFPKDTGMSFDEMAETLSQHGYTSKDYSANELLDLVDRSLSGEQVQSNAVDYELLDQVKRYKNVSGNLTQEQTQKAVEKALAGKTLGVREARVVSNLMDEYSNERTSEATIDSAKEQLEEARSLRRRAKAGFPPIEAYNDDAAIDRAGELFEENEYPAEATGEERTLLELMTELHKLGVSAGEIESIIVFNKNNSDRAKELFQKIGELHGETKQPEQQKPKGLPTTAETDRRDASSSGQIQGQREEQSRSETPEVKAKGLPGAESSRRRDAERANRTDKNGDRRTHKSARDLYSEMSHEELLTELLSNELTGIKNRRAFVVELEYADNVFSLDADSLKWFNDNMSPNSGDSMLQEIADILSSVFGDDVYHISGDEFYVLDNGTGIADIEAKLIKAQKALEAAVIHAVKPDGTKITKTGVAFTYGIGKTKDAADNELKREKSEKEKRGERTARGEEPAGVTRERSVQPANEGTAGRDSSEGSSSDGKRTEGNDRPELKAKGLPVTDDLFGGKTDTQQAIHDKKQAQSSKEKNAPDMHEGKGDLFSDSNKQADIESEAVKKTKENLKAQKSKSTAPEHEAVGVDDRELDEIVSEFKSYQEDMIDIEGEDKISHVFDAPAKKDIVNLNKKAGVTTKNVDGKRVYNRDAGWLTVEEAKKRIDEWEANAVEQGKGRNPINNGNGDKVVISLFDLTGSWSLPWEQAGYQVYRFDIQDEQMNDVYGEELNIGDINNHSYDMYADIYGMFDGMDVHAILGACPCTDFANSGARHFAAKDKDGRTASSVNLVHQALAVVEYFKPAVWAIENPVGRIEKLGGLPPWRLSFDPFHVGDTYTKKTLLWGRFNADLPIAPVDPIEGSKMHTNYGGKSIATKNARSATPEGFAYSFFAANNAVDHPVMAIANKYDRLNESIIKEAVELGIPEADISNAVDDFYYMDHNDEGANEALQELIDETKEDQQDNKAEEKTDSKEVKHNPDDVGSLKYLWGMYDDTGEFTHPDLVNEIEELIDDLDSSEFTKTLGKAVSEYRKEQKDDQELGGRGDMDAAEEAFNDVVLSILKPADNKKSDIEKTKANLNKGKNQPEETLELFESASKEVTEIEELKAKLAKNKKADPQRVSVYDHDINEFIDYIEGMTGDGKRSIAPLPMGVPSYTEFRDTHLEDIAHLGYMLEQRGWKFDQDNNEYLKGDAYVSIEDRGSSAAPNARFGLKSQSKKKKAEVDKTKANLAKSGIPSSMRHEGKYKDLTINDLAKKFDVQDTVQFIPEDLQNFIIEKWNENAKALANVGLNNGASQSIASKNGVSKESNNLGGISAAFEQLAMNFKRIEKNHKDQSKTQTAKALSMLKDAIGDLPRDVKEYVNVDEGTILNFHEQQGKSPKNISKLLYKLGIESEVLSEDFTSATFKSDGYMDLHVEKLPTDNGKEALYFTHYYKQNGDMVMDSEMVFDINAHGQLFLRETAVNGGLGGELRGYDAPFAVLFSKNLLAQGFGEDKAEADFDPIEEAEKFQKDDDAKTKKAEDSITKKKRENRESRLNDDYVRDRAYKIVAPLSDEEIKNLPKIKLQEIMPLIGSIKTGTKKDLANRIIEWKAGHFLGMLEDMPNGIELDMDYRETADGSFPIVHVKPTYKTPATLISNETEANTPIEALAKVSKYVGGSVYKKSKGMTEKGFEFKTIESAQAFIKYVTGKTPIIKSGSTVIRFQEDKALLDEVIKGDTIQVVDKTSAYAGLTGKVKDIYYDDYYESDFYLVDIKTPEEDGGFTEEEEFTVNQLGKAPTEKKPAKNYGKKNTIVKEDAAAKAREVLRKKLGQLNSGVDPEILQAGITLAVYHVEAGARSFGDYSKAMVNDLGDVVRPYLRAWYEAARYYPGMDNEGMTPANLVEDATIETEENNNDTSSDGNLEQDSEAARTQDELGEESNESDGRPAKRNDGRSSQVNEQGGNVKQDNQRVPTDSTTADRESRNNSIYQQDGLFGSPESTARPDDSKRSSGTRDQGIQPERRPSGSLKRSAKKNETELEQRLAAQKAAENLPVKLNDINNIRETVPVLLPEQQDDVLKAENRFFVDNKKGMLFTNGTGTGKTYTGLGIAKRYEMQGKDNILILVPTDKKAKDWIEDGENINLDITQLDGIKDAGNGIVVTTYANFRDNESLVKREWDLILPDESHKLLSNAQSKDTSSLIRFRQVTNHENGLKAKAELSNKKWQGLLRKVEKEAERITTDPNDYEANYRELRYGTFADYFNELDDEIKNDIENIKENDKTKVAFLSATPFAYVQSIDYAESYLYEFPKQEGDDLHYNTGNQREQFYMTHFGYRMRYNKLTRPEAGVNLDYMERQFHKHLMETGALSGRKLNVDKDYSRQFIEIDSKLGEKIDSGISELSFSKRIEDENGDAILGEDGLPQYKYKLLPEWSRKQFNYLFMNRLLENLKAAEATSRIKDHLALGRKVVVFHSYNQGRLHNPFIIPENIDGDAEQQSDWTKERSQFMKENPDLLTLNLANLINPIEQLSKEFGTDLLMFNGKVPKGQRNKNIKAFNDNDSGKNILLVQIEAGKEGISLHDIDAQHQRALISLGMPNKPTDAIQMEGRIYRTGQASDAVFEYFKLGLGFEERTFAHTIAERSRTAENLAMGFEGRNMERAFIDGYLNSVDDAPSLEQGVGGKEADGRADEENGFDSAKTFYYANQKKTSRNKAQEGADYFATPEPLGYKMAEWANLQPNEKALEPSAGHGAIGRFFPDYTINQFVEPSHQLIGKLSLNVSGDVKHESFEELNLVNKYDGIIMNPPFGTAGRTAVDHIAKAFRHLRNGGRIVAILPEGSATDKFNKWFYDGETAVNGYMVADISLPPVTFKRAGTSVKTRIVIIEKQNDKQDALKIRQRKVDIQAESVEEFFDEIEDLSFNDRIEPTKPDPKEEDTDSFLTEADNVPQNVEPAATPVAANTAANGNFELIAGVHTKKGHKIWTVKYNERVPREEFLEHKAKASEHKGRYSFYKGNGAIPGYIFTDENQANKFYNWITGDSGGGSRFKLDTKPAYGGFSVSGIKGIIKPLQDSWKNAPEIKVIQTVDELPNHVIDELLSVDSTEEAQGMFDPDTNKVWMVADNIRSEAEAVEVLLHEVVGHFGLRQIFGNKLNPFLGEVYLKYGNKGLADIAETYSLDLNKRDDRLTAAEEMLAHLAEKGESPTLVNKAIALVAKLLRKIFPKLKLTNSEIKQIIAKARKSVEDGNNTPPTGGKKNKALYSLKNDKSPEQSILNKVKEGQPIDKIFRALYELPDNQLKKILGIKSDQPITKEAYDRLADMVENGNFKPDSKMQWLNPIMEKARHGLIDRYKLTPEYLQRDQRREADQVEFMEKGVDIINSLTQAGVNAQEAEVLQAVLTGEQIPDGMWNDIAVPIRKAIDELGQEAVLLGLLSQETYEKNKGSYLHRVYKKHEADQTSLTGWVSKALSSRRKAVVGNQLKRRGIDMKVDEAKLRAGLTEWFGSKQNNKPDSALIGQKFHVFDRVQAVGQGTETFEGMGSPGKKAKNLERVYWPSDKPIPKKYSGWENRGEWEVTGKKNGKYELWRDFTKEERTNMGEIIDARYTIAKTFQVMSADLANGRFLKDIAENQEWTWHEEGEPENMTDQAHARFGTFSQFEWVKVPTSAIEGTGGKKRWGVLAGKYVRAEIWRDLNQLDQLQKPRLWNTILTQWKLNKTARNPVVHLNNVMSNLIFMDMADVRMIDLKRAFHALRNKTDDYKDAEKHGAFGSTYVHQELKRDVLDPLLDELIKQNMNDKGTMESMIGSMGKYADVMWKHLGKADSKMINFYQMEDEVFRMATYLRRQNLGDSKEEAALLARDQFLNYDIRAPWVNMARATVLPFISYTYRAVPVIAKSVATRPWKVAKLATIAYALNAMGYLLAPGDEDEERRSMRDEIQGKTWLGTPRNIRMPFRDEHDNPVFLDIRRWIPAGDVFDMNQGQGVLPIPAPLQFSGPLMLAFEAALNKTAFTGKEIYDKKTDTAWDKTKKATDWAWKSWMPSAPWVYNSWYWDKIVRSASGGRDVLGRDYDMKYALSSAMGVKLAPHDVQLNMSWREREIMSTVRELKFDLRQNGMDKERKLINNEQFNNERKHIEEKLKRLEKKAKELQGK